jgi:hypothetical protein
MNKEQLKTLLMSAALKAKPDEDELDYIIEVLERNGFVYKLNDVYQQFPVNSKHAKKLARICEHPDCLKRPRTHGLCQTHYLQARRKGLIGEPSKCTIEHCNNPVEARGLCFQHYRSAARKKMDQ